jgi:SAM-dependent methyltransferase
VACCCDSEYACAADGQFTVQRAARDLDSYRANGPGVTTRMLRDGLIAAGPISGSLLDIGAGIGALTFELLARGISQAIAVDASSAYIATASQEADKRGIAQAIRFVRGDFLDVARELQPATIVTLDRVICCYPSYQRLLAEVLRHAKRLVALSYPRDVWYVHAGNALENAGRRVRRRPFRTFVHPVPQLERIIAEAGFTRAVRKQTATWCADIYARS